MRSEPVSHLQVVDDAYQANNSTSELFVTLKPGGGDGTFDDMNTTDLNTRITRIEGGWHIFQWACAVVTAVIIGGMALLLTVQLSTQSDVKALSARVDGLSSQVEALPGRINSNLMELNRTLSQAITASKDQPPQVILVPAPQVQSPSQTAPNQ